MGIELTQQIVTHRPFELTKFFIIAGSDNTDIIRNGVVVSFLNTGESEAFTVNQGDLITSTRPIQVHLLTGDTGDSYELRWYALVRELRLLSLKSYVYNIVLTDHPHKNNYSFCSG